MQSAESEKAVLDLKECSRVTLWLMPWLILISDASIDWLARAGIKKAADFVASFAACRAVPVLLDKPARPKDLDHCCMATQVLTRAHTR